MDRPRENQWAAIYEWPSRWNEAEAVACVNQSGSDVMAVGFFGFVNLDLKKPADTAAVVAQCRAFADLVEKTQREYDSA